MTVGERIKARRKELDINADTLANVLGVSRSTVFRYENGDIEKFPTAILEPIARALHTSPAYLMGWEDEKGTPVSGAEGECNKAIIDLLNSLPEDKKPEALNYLRYLAEKEDK